MSFDNSKDVRAAFTERTINEKFDLAVFASLLCLICKLPAITLNSEFSIILQICMSINAFYHNSHFHLMIELCKYLITKHLKHGDSFKNKIDVCFLLSAKPSICYRHNVSLYVYLFSLNNNSPLKNNMKS